MRLTFAAGGDRAELWRTFGLCEHGFPPWSPDATLDLADFAWNEIRIQSGANNGGNTGYEFFRIEIEVEVVYCTTTTYCNPGDGSPNNAATISISHCDLDQDEITVDLTNAPPNQFTYLLIGDSNGVVNQPPGSKGDLCIVGGSCLARYDKDLWRLDSCGSCKTSISNSVSGGPNYGIPTCGGHLQPGDTWFFQYWHRQPMGQPSTFSEAICVTFE